MSAARFLSAAEVAEELGVSEATAYRLMRGMRTLRVGRLVKVARADLERWIEANTATAPRDAAADRERPPVMLNGKPLIRPIVPRTKPRPPDAALPPSIRPTQPRIKRRGERT